MACLCLAGCEVGEALDSNAPAGPDAGAAVADADPAAPDADPAAPDAGPGQPTQQTVLEDFGQCMTLADWDANNLGQIALTLTDVGQVCADCHSLGAGGNYLTADSTQTFQEIKTYPYVLKYATTDLDLNVVKSDRLILKGQEPGTHPTFELPLELQQGLQNFYDLTNARYLAGDCP